MEAIDHQGEGVPRLGLSASGQRLPLFWKAEVRREYPGADRELGGGGPFPANGLRGWPGLSPRPLGPGKGGPGVLSSFNLLEEEIYIFL